MLAVAYGLLAYFILPDLWTRYERRRALTNLPLVTRNAQDIPGDPINVGVAGTQEDVIRALHAAGWSPADAITLKSSIGIVESVLLDRADPDAPVSNLYYNGRREDLAFEKASGISADRRHHVRFWNVYQRAGELRGIWLGAASFDRGIGVSHYTGAVTHHIAPDVDAERDGLVQDLVRAGVATAVYRITASEPRKDDHNAEGDPYFTDGKILVVRLRPHGQPNTVTPEEIAISPSVGLDDALWNLVLTSKP